jgi:hypothetical protein
MMPAQSNACICHVSIALLRQQPGIPHCTVYNTLLSEEGVVKNEKVVVTCHVWVQSLTDGISDGMSHPKRTQRRPRRCCFVIVLPPPKQVKVSFAWPFDVADSQSTANTSHWLGYQAVQAC